MGRNDELEATLSRRNGQSVMQSLDQMNNQLAKLHDRVSALTQTVAMLSNQLMVIDQFIAVQRAKLMGTGATKV